MCAPYTLCDCKRGLVRHAVRPAARLYLALEDRQALVQTLSHVEALMKAHVIAHSSASLRFKDESNDISTRDLLRAFDTRQNVRINTNPVNVQFYLNHSDGFRCDSSFPIHTMRHSAAVPLRRIEGFEPEV